MLKRFLCSVILLACFSAVFASSMDKRVRSVPKEIREAVFQKPKDNLPSLVKALTNGLGTDAKVKVIHDWICDNIAYDSDMYFSGRISKQDSASVLKKQKAVCSGYSNLMADMCNLAGVEAIVIDGYSKGFGYTGKLGDKSDHAWNAVKKSGGWQLIDVTWDAGYLDYKAFIKQYSTQWFSLTPLQFIYSHLPLESEMQLLPKEKQRSKEMFVKEPYLSGVFFENGLSLGKNACDYTNEINGATTFDFGISKQNLLLVSDLVDREGGSSVKNATWIDHKGSTFSVNVDIPTAKKYRARLLCRPRNALQNPQFFTENEFEQSIRPRVLQLLAEKKITEKEKEFFGEAFFKVDENRRYYPAEDLFATERNNAVTKILKLLDENTGSYAEVMYFDVVPASGYAGFGSDVLRFPTTFRSYGETLNTKLVSPLGAVLKAGEEVRFEIQSKDFLSMAVVVNDALQVMSKNAKAGSFELTLTVPHAQDTLEVMASKDGKRFDGLWFYEIEQ